MRQRLGIAAAESASQKHAEGTTLVAHSELAEAHAEAIDESVRNQDYIESIRDLMNYLKQIDERQSDKIECVKYMALKAGLEGQATLTVGGKERAVKGFATLTKLVKQAVCRAARLKTILSDEDFLGGKFLCDEEEGRGKTQEKGDSPPALSVVEIAALVDEITVPA